MEPDKKFLFDVNIFDAPPKEEIAEDLPPPPPTFSEDELAGAKDMAFEQGRQQGQKEQVESREQHVAVQLENIANHFSHLFAAETVRESIFEKEALVLAISTLDLLYPTLNEKLGFEEVYKAIEKTLIAHRKTKTIKICVPPGLRAEIEVLISRIRANEHENVLWQVTEDPSLTKGDCTLEWSDGGAVRDSVRIARDIRKNIEALLGQSVPKTPELDDSEPARSDVSLRGKAESVKTAEKNDE